MLPSYITHYIDHNFGHLLIFLINNASDSENIFYYLNSGSLMEFIIPS